MARMLVGRLLLNVMVRGGERSVWEGKARGGEGDQIAQSNVTKPVSHSVSHSVSHTQSVVRLPCVCVCM